MSEEIKMRKITPKSWKERYKEDAPESKNLPSGHIDFDDYKDLKSCVIGSTILIKQKVKVKSISETGISYDIMEMGAMKLRNPRKNNSSEKEEKEY